MLELVYKANFFFFFFPKCISVSSLKRNSLEIKQKKKNTSEKNYLWKDKGMWISVTKII